jgi:hypothetical protein
MVNIRGPEGKNILGSFAEDEIEAFFSNFLKWKLLYKNFDETFLEVESENDEIRGFDFLYQLYEPFDKYYKNHGIIIESKKIADTAIFNKSRLSKDIQTLKYKIEKAQTSKELHEDEKIRDNDIHYFRYGILCYRFKEFDFNKYYKVLKEYQMKNKSRGSNFPVIFVLSNDRLSTFIELMNLVDDKKSIEYLYPPYKANGWENWDEKLSLFYLFSDIIPFKADNKKNILSFDKPSVNSFNFIQEFCKKFLPEISSITIARGEYDQDSLYKQYKVEFDKTVDKILELDVLNNEMNCSTNLTKVFKK